MADLTPELLAAKLMRAAQGVHDETVKAMRDAALDVEATAKRNCTPGESPYDSMEFLTKLARNPDATGAPFDTGLLRARIDSKVEEEGDRITGLVGVFGEGEGDEPGYALYVHEGTSKMQARPYLFDAIVEKKPETEQKLHDAVTKGILKAAL